MGAAVANFNDTASLQMLWGAHLRQLWPGATLSRFAQLSAGFSWRTFAFETARPVGGRQAFILQVGPPDGLLAPYATRPQRLALESLTDAEIPVPAPTVLASAEGGAPFGAPWMVTDRMPGDVPLPWTLRRMPEGEARMLSEDFVDTLARLHAVRWSQHPVGQIDAHCTPHNANLRQVDYWARRVRQWQRKPHPGLAFAERWLRVHAPAAPRVALVHGDYRIGNFLSSKGAITGVLDWEMVHLGDPHEDLAWALLPMFNGGSRELFGRMSRAEVFERYERASGMSVQPESIRFHETLALYKSIAIDLAAITRFEDGTLHDLRLAAMGTQVAPILKQLLRTLEATP